MSGLEDTMKARQRSWQSLMAVQRERSYHETAIGLRNAFVNEKETERKGEYEGDRYFRNISLAVSSS